MNRTKTALSLCALLGLAPVARAEPTINVGDHTNIPISSSATLDVFYDGVTGGGPMEGQTLYISIADAGNGGFGSADPGEPKIVNVDSVAGTGWEGHLNHVEYFADNNQLWEADQTNIAILGPVDAIGKVFTITLDTTGVAPGSTWPLRIFFPLPEFPGSFDSNWSAFFEYGVPFAGSNGSFTIVQEPSSVVPEPSLVVLGLFAVAGFAAVTVRKRLARQAS